MDNVGRRRVRKHSHVGRWLCCVVLSLPLILVQAGNPGTVASAQSPISYSSVPLQSWRVNGEGRAVLKVGDVVYVGGSFTRSSSPDNALSAIRYNLAAFDVNTGVLISSFRSDTDGPVSDLATDGTSLFVSGSFNTIGGVTRRKLAAIDLATGAVRTSFKADANSTVHSMSLAAGKLYIAGVFSNINGSPRTRLAAVDPATGDIDDSFTPSADGTVNAIAATPDGATVYIGGPYDEVNGVADENISVLNGTTGARIGPELSGVTGFVDDLEVTPDGKQLLAAHSGVPGIGNRTAVYDTATGNNRWVQVVEGDVQGVHLVGDMVYSGFHDGARGDGATRVAGYALSGGTEDFGFHPTFDRFMGARAVHGDADALVVGGDFSVVSGVRAEGFVIFPTAPPTNFAATKWGSESWQYLDNGTDQGTAWVAPGFDDTGWKSGIGEFGYTNGGERTKISYGPSWSSKYITTYFRTTFEASVTPESAAIYMRVDDGAVVYVNGVEAARDNLAPGTVDHLTLAADRSGDSEASARYFAIDPALIVVGTNTLAVEVHQSSPSSDDLKFFATFVAYGQSETNRLPIAVADLDTVVGPAPHSVTFDGTGSSDPDGSIATWEWDFGDGAAGSGSTVAHTYTEPGLYTATLTVTDDDGGVATTSRNISVAEPPESGRVVDVTPEANWSYLDDGSSLGSEWSRLDYPASGWSTGVGEFGYGDGDENTVVSFGPAPTRKFLTTYFRTLFVARATPTDLTLTLRVDDGAVAYLNGAEVARFNMADGPISAASRAPQAIYGSGETTDREFTLDPALVQAGPNVLAVEVHQNGLASSDLTFLASLVGTGDGPPPPPPPANVAPVPVASATPVVGEAPLLVAFDASSSSDADGTVVEWAWDFGDGTNATGKTSSHEYVSAGVYSATLTVTDDDGATASVAIQVTATDPSPPPPPPTGVVVDVANTATWSYSDVGEVAGTTWTSVDFDDADWSTGVGEFGYGDGDESTVVSYGPSASQKYPTTYFRTSFTASQTPADLTMTLRVDDGAIVYVNGTEAARFNMPTGPVTYRTRAPDAIYGSGERADRQLVLDPSLVVAGENVLAVEVHQNGGASSDLSFLASLTGSGTGEPPPPPPAGRIEVAADATWSYSDVGDIADATWNTVAFDDADWSTGVGEFGYGDGDETTVVSYGPSAGQKHRTTYFRTSFTADAVPSKLELTLRVDDGAVVYLNGAEVVRSNLPTGGITFGTAAPSAIYGSAEREDRVHAIDPSLIVVGENVIAVEVHQNTLGSSDLSFLAALLGAP